MMNEEKTCPCCPNHCPLSALSCEKGERYVQNGEAAPDHEKHGHRGGHRMPDLNSTAGLLQACGHVLHHRRGEDSGMFEALSETERKELDRLLKKLVESWSEKEHGRETPSL